MTTVRLQNILADLARETSSNLYVIFEISESEVCALLVPKGSEGKPCVNTLPLEVDADTLPAGDWMQIVAPTMICVSEASPLLKAHPRLEVIGKSA